MTPSERAQFAHEVASAMHPRPDPGLTLLAAKVDGLAATTLEMKDAIRELVTVMTRLALVEERISQVNDALGRAFKSLDSHGNRLQALDMGQPIAKQQQGWVSSGLAVLAGAAAMFFLKKMGVVL